MRALQEQLAPGLPALPPPCRRTVQAAHCLPRSGRGETQEREGLGPARVAGDGGLQMALPSGVASAMPCSCSTLNTAVLLDGMPSIPWVSRWARSLSGTVYSPATAYPGQPSVRGLRLVQLEFLKQVAQAVQQLALQCVPGRGQSPCWDHRRVLGLPMPGRLARPVRRACRHVS